MDESIHVSITSVSPCQSLAPHSGTLADRGALVGQVDREVVLRGDVPVAAVATVPGRDGRREDALAR